MQIKTVHSRRILNSHGEFTNEFIMFLNNGSIGRGASPKGESISIYDAAKMVAQTFELDASLIGKTTRKEFLVGKPAEPFNSSLCIHKLEQLGIKMHTFQEGLDIIKGQQHV